MAKRRKRKDGHKQHLFDHGEAVDPKLLLVHRELEFLREGARAHRPRGEHARRMGERARKLDESRREVGV